MIMQCKRQEFALCVVPSSLVPGDIPTVEELRTTKQRVGYAELYELTVVEGAIASKSILWTGAGMATCC